MNTLQKKLLIGLTVLGMGTATIAAHAEKEGGDRGAVAQGWNDKGGAGRFAEHMQQRIAKRQAELHDKLKLSAAQEPAWKTFVAASLPSGPALVRHHGEDRGAIMKLSAPERMEKMLGLMKERQARMEERVAALKTFYATLSADQQKIFNDNFGRGHHGRGGRHGR